MNKRQILDAMIAKMDEYDIAEKALFKKHDITTLDIHNLHKEYINKAMQIAENNGCKDCKYQLWDDVCKHRERKLGIKPSGERW